MQCSTQHFSMPTHCPAFLCRAIALPNKAMLLSAIALRYIALPLLIFSRPVVSFPRRFHSQPFRGLPFHDFSSAIQSRAPPLQIIGQALRSRCTTCLCRCITPLCATLPWRSDSLPYPGTALLCHAIPQPSASGHCSAFLMLCRPPPSTGSVHHLKPRIRRETYRRGQESHSQVFLPT